MQTALHAARPASRFMGHLLDFFAPAASAQAIRFNAIVGCGPEADKDRRLPLRPHPAPQERWQPLRIWDAAGAVQDCLLDRRALHTAACRKAPGSTIAK